MMRSWLGLPEKAASPPKAQVQPKAKGQRGPGKKKLEAELLSLQESQQEGDTVPEVPALKKAKTQAMRIAELEEKLAQDKSDRELQLEQAVRNAAEQLKEAQARLLRKGSASSLASSMSPETKELQGVRLAMFAESEFENPGRLYSRSDTKPHSTH